MRLRALLAAVALLVAGSPASVPAGELTAALTAPGFTASDLMARYGLDTLFQQFGTTIAASPRVGGVTDEHFLGAWEQSALDAFSGAKLNAVLADRLSRGLDGADLTTLGAFMGSPIGQKIGALEHETQTVPADRQIGLVAKGQTLYLEVSPQRRAQVDELMSLTGADMVFEILRESIRGMAISLRLSGKDGDITQNWADIDTEVQDQLAGMRDSLDEATRAVLAYTYASLSDAEIEDYLQFLRTPATRKFYALTTSAIGDILQQTMLGLGKDVARRLHAVQI